jgi:hypothetical protein
MQTFSSPYVSDGQKRRTTLWWPRFLRKPAVKKDLSAPPVLIFQFGKVGSSSLLDSLAPQWPGLVVHAHTLKKRENEPEHMAVARKFLSEKKDPVFVITLVRDPIGRNISAFFQNFERETGVSERQCHTLPIEHLIEVFLSKFPHDFPLNWFNEHLKEATGIDVFEHEFPKSGVQIIRRGNVNLLVMVSEIPDWMKEAAVKQFLALDEFRLRSANVGSKKRYAATYRQFLQSFVAPNWYVQRMYGSQFFQHFYSPRKEALVAQWTRELSHANGAGLETLG